jgi:hypothetical protein
MSTIDSENISKQTPDAAQPKVRRKLAKKAKAVKKAPKAKKAAGKPKSDGTNKKAEVITLMKRAKGATLAEIMAATDWQAHTVRGFVSSWATREGFFWFSSSSS